MITVRKGTFETNSSSTHSFCISRDSKNFEYLRRLFDSILYGDHYMLGISDIYDEEGLLKILEKLNEAQTIILAGTEDYD